MSDVGYLLASQNNVFRHYSLTCVILKITQVWHLIHLFGHRIKYDILVQHATKSSKNKWKSNTSKYVN